MDQIIILLWMLLGFVAHHVGVLTEMSIKADRTVWPVEYIKKRFWKFVSSLIGLVFSYGFLMVSFGDLLTMNDQEVFYLLCITAGGFGYVSHDAADRAGKMAMGRMDNKK